MTEPETMLRPYDPALDQSLVLDSWTRQIRKMSHCRAMGAGQWTAHRRLLLRLIDRCPPVMAVEPGHPKQAHGFLCAELQPHGLRVMHFLYVRYLFRRQGVATHLLRSVFEHLGKEPIYYTHKTRQTHHHVKRWGLAFDPYRVSL